MIKQANRVPQKKAQRQKYLNALNQITSEIVELKFQIRTHAHTATTVTPSNLCIPSKSD